MKKNDLKKISNRFWLDALDALLEYVEGNVEQKDSDFAAVTRYAKAALRVARDG